MSWRYFCKEPTAGAAHLLGVQLGNKVEESNLLGVKNMEQPTVGARSARSSYPARERLSE